MISVSFSPKLRDEAHRFAVSTHQKKEEERSDSSSFDNINGIEKN